MAWEVTSEANSDVRGLMGVSLVASSDVRGLGRGNGCGFSDVGGFRWHGK